MLFFSIPSAARTLICAMGIVLSLSITAQRAFPQEAHPPSKSAETALVLSGGGSRGIVHAGFLVGFKEAGHDPDIVIGTSMGALVGALYAAGYEPEEIERQIRSVRWGEMFTPAPLLLGPERESRFPLLSFDREANPLRFNRGFIPQWRINRALTHLLFDANARSRGDFDRLARRFRAVAADLESGDTVVLARGDLARAVRASMAVPGIFAPVEWEERVLIDGGVADNLPIEVGREMGAERVIAVDVSRPSEEIEGRSPLQVVGRALDLLQDNADSNQAPPDILILPDLPPNQQGITFPGDPGAYFQIGRDAASSLPVIPEIERRALRDIPPPPEAFGALHIEAPDSATALLAQTIFKDIAPGPYDPARVLRAVDQLYTTGLFEAVWPRVDEDGPERMPTLVIRLVAPPRTTNSGSIGYDSDRGGRAWGAMQRSTVLFNSPTVLTLAASANRLEQWGELSARLHLPHTSLLSLSSGVYYQETDVRRFSASSLLEDQEVERVGIWMGGELQHALSIRMLATGLKAEHLRIEGFASTAPGENGESGEASRAGMAVGPYFRWSTQTPEPLLVGLPLEVEGDVRLGSFRYARVGARGARIHSFGNLWAAALLDGTITGGDTPPDALPSLGDGHLVPGFRWGEERGNVRAVAGLDLAYPLLPRGYLRTRIRSGAVGASVSSLGESSRWVTGVDIGALWRTPFGALTLGGGLNTTGSSRLHVDLGASF